MTAPDAHLARRSSDHAACAPLFIPLLALWLHFLRFGYGYGASDQGELLPAVLHRLHEHLYAADWFVQTQASSFSVRFYVVSLLEGVAHLMPLWLAVTLLYVVAWLAIAYAVYAIGWEFSRQPLAAALAVGLGLVVTPQWTLGGNALVGSMFTPSLAGWALALWGLYFYLRGRLVGAALLLGLATWMQALVGLQVAGLCGLLLLAARTTRWRPVLQFGGWYLLAAIPLLAPLALEQMAQAVEAGSHGRSLFYIMAEFRNPHHYLFLSFAPSTYVKFGLLALLGSAGYCLLGRGDALQHRGFLWRSWLLIGILCGIGLLFTELAPVLFVAKLQLFKYTVLAKLLLIIVVSATVVRYLPATLRMPVQRLYGHRGWWLGAMLVIYLATGAGLAQRTPALYAKVRPLAHRTSAIDAIERWARQHTSTSAVFAVPPSWSGFRTRARRAVVVDFKSFPYQKSHTYTWYDRLMAIAPVRSTRSSGGALLPLLDSAFQAQTPAAWQRWQQRYGVDYVVTKRHADTAGLQAVHASGPWTVYRLRS